MIPAVFMNVERDQSTVFRYSLLFALGLTALLVLGLIPSRINETLVGYFNRISPVSGIVVIAFGVLFLWRSSDYPFGSPQRIPLGAASALLIGVAFGLVWTHCLGPILSLLIRLASMPATATRGAFLISVYGAGLATSFVLLGLLVRKALHLFVERGNTDHHALAFKLSSIVLIVIGLSLVMTDSWIAVSQIFTKLTSNSLSHYLNRILMAMLNVSA